MQTDRRISILGLVIPALFSFSLALATPQSVTESTRQIPVAATVDVVVVGGSSAAVAAAEAAAKNGARVFLLAPRSYLGEDLAGTLRLWLEAAESAVGTPAEAVWGREAFVKPSQLKKRLDGMLLGGKVDFLYGAYPTDLLIDGAGKPCGLVMANRAGRQAVIAKVVIDASEYAVVARLAGARFSPFQGGPQRVKWITIAGQARRADGVSVRKLALPLEISDIYGRVRLKEAKADWFEYTVSVEQAEDSWRARAELDQRVRDLAYDPSQLFSADAAFLIPASQVKGRTSAEGRWPGADRLDLKVFQPAGVERTWVLGGRADLSRELAARLLRPVSFMTVGARVGKAAAIQARALPAPQGVRVARTPAAGEGAGEVQEMLGGLRPFPGSPRVPQAAGALPVLGHYDVVVVGGGSSGAAAGIGAARRGARTLVVEYLDGLGGVGTLGMIGKYWKGYRAGFTKGVPQNPIEVRMEWYRHELRLAGAEIWFGALGCGALVERNRVIGVVVATPRGRGVVLARAVIDSTGNADIAIAGGAGYQYVNDDFAIQDSHRPRREVGASYSNGGFPSVADADPIQVRNALLVKNELSFDWGPLIATRERRRIAGDFTLDWLDQINRRTFPDSILYAQSDYDSHGYQVHPFFALRPARVPGDYGRPFNSYVPYRCLLPRGLEGILVTGLAISAHRDAMPIVRMQPEMNNVGYAAGAAAALAVKAGTTPRRIDVKALQRHLVEMGNLPSSVLTDRDSCPMPRNVVEAAVKSVKQDFLGLEALLAQPQDSVPLLRQALAGAEGRDKVHYAEVLALLGDAAGLPVLLAEAARLEKEGVPPDAPERPTSCLNQSNPDDFNRLALALGYTRDRRATSALLRLVLQVPANDYMKWRSVVISLNRIGDPSAARMLAKILNEQLGHLRAREAEWRRLNVEPMELDRHEGPVVTPWTIRTRSRDDQPWNAEVPLRALLAACALYRCGDRDGLARRSLEDFVRGPNGLWSELASQVLSRKPGEKALE